MAWFRRRRFKRRRIGGFRRRSFRRRRYFRRFRRTLRRFAIGSPERKYEDTAISGNVPSITPTVTPALLTGIEEGTDNNQRVGRRVMLTSAQIRLSFEGIRDSGSNHNTSIIRILLVQDTQYDAAVGAPPTLADVLDQTITSNVLVFNDLQIQGTKRFRTLWDKIFTLYLHVPNVVDSYPSIKIHNYYKKMRKTLFFNGVDGTAASAGKNALWLFIFKDGPADTINITGVSRVRFTDV